MEKPKWAYYSKNEERWERLLLHHAFLKKIEDSEGNLWCEYCGKSELIAYTWDEKHDRKKMATVDHFLPKSKYPDLANEETNFIVACSTCNETKKDDLWEEETIKYSRKNKLKIN